MEPLDQPVTSHPPEQVAPLDYRRVIGYGLLVGGITVGWLLVACLIGPDAFLNRGVYFATYAFYLVGMYRAAATVRSESLLPYVRPALLVFVIANVCYYLLFYLLFSDPSSALIERQWELLQGTDAAKSMIWSDLVVTAAGTFKYFVQSIIGGALLAVLVAFGLSRR